MIFFKKHVSRAAWSVFSSWNVNDDPPPCCWVLKVVVVNVIIIIILDGASSPGVRVPVGVSILDG